MLAGGHGSRLYPVTRGLSKQLLPIYNKPMIHYPLFTLMAAGIREIRIITTEIDQPNFIRQLGNGTEIGIEISYSVQSKPGGIGQAFKICEDYISNRKCALILGDNLFYGPGLGREFSKYIDVIGAQIFAYPVSNPSDYGIVELNEKGKPIDLVEKPENSKSNLAIPGLYFYDETVTHIAGEVNPSARGEIEITDINKIYLENKNLNVSILPRGTVWFDTGSFKNLHDASSFVRILEERQGMKVACLEEVSWRQGWISSEQLEVLAFQYKDETRNYLISLIH